LAKKKNFLIPNQKVEEVTKIAKKNRKIRLKTIIKTVIFSVQVRVFSGFWFSVFFGLCSSG